ncbi:hypothetical protein YC2023_033922 [Brassica napus]
MWFIYELHSWGIKSTNSSRNVVFVWIPQLRNAEADMYAKQALSLIVREVGEAVLMPPPN